MGILVADLEWQLSAKIASKKVRQKMRQVEVGPRFAAIGYIIAAIIKNDARKIKE